MTTVLISIIGRGIDSGSGYRTVKYKFSDGNTYETSFFGSALLRNLKEQKQPVSKWLIMGTAQSNWCDLPYMFDAEVCLAFQERHREFIGDLKADADRNIGGGVSDEDLQKWQKLITEKSPDTEIICRKVGNATNQESFDKIIQSLLDVVEDSDRIVFDITHGFRTQPIITSFALMYLRWLKNIESIELFYGGEAAEIRGQVIELSFCNNLLKATEAVAIYQQTGNYAPLGASLNLSNEFSEKLSRLRFADEINRSDRKTPKELSQDLQSIDLNVFQDSIGKLIKEALDWTAKESLAERLGYKARFAFEHKQYLKSIVLLWETILVAGCKKYGMNPDTREAREAAENELYRMLTGDEREILKKIEWLRNSVTHSSRTSDGDVQRALNEEKSFQELFEKGWTLFQKLMGK